MAEAFTTSGTRVRALDAPLGIDSESFAAYAFYVDNHISKVALINMKPYYVNSTSDFTIQLDLSSLIHTGNGTCVRAKRLTAPYVNTGDSSLSTWAGQAFPLGEPVGDIDIEIVGGDGGISVRGSEAVLVFFDDNVYGL
jgi:hypothetical protein